MKRFRNILLVAGLGDGPVPRYLFARALALSKRNAAKLTLIDVVSRPGLVPEVVPHEVLELTLTHRRESLLRLAASAREQGLEVDTALAAGTPFLEITRRVQQFRHDLVITDGGRGEDAGRVVDSTTMHLMRKCPCAIWVARPTSSDRYERILAAVDPDPTDAERSSLNRMIMELAVSLAKLEASELHVVHAWEQFGLPVDSSADVWVKWQEAARAEVNRRFYELLSEHPVGSDPQVHLVGGKPAPSISRLAREEQIDLLVMGTVCRTGIRGFLIGNTAEGVLQRVDCSLLTVKPRGFVSPIQPVGDSSRLSEPPGVRTGQTAP